MREFDDASILASYTPREQLSDAIADLSDGALHIKDKRVTGFSNAEEILAELDKLVPFLTESEMVARGAIYQKAEQPWAAFAVEDARVITGQNPASGGAVADLVIARLKATA